MKSYTSGLIDGIALISVTILLLLAALFAGGCSHAVATEPLQYRDRLLDLRAHDRSDAAGREDAARGQLSDPSVPSHTLLACEIVDLETGRRAPCPGS